MNYYIFKASQTGCSWKQAPELYDLSKDIGESTDLAASRKDIADKLSGLYTAWKSSLPEPIWYPLGDGIE